MPDQSKEIMRAIPSGLEVRREWDFNFNPFQISTLLGIIRNYDKYQVRSSEIRQNNQSFYFDPHDSMINITNNLSMPDLNVSGFNQMVGFQIKEHVAKLLFCSQAGIHTYDDLLEVCLRGILDIDSEKYQKMYTAFNNYTTTINVVPTGVLRENDPRLLSNNPDFKAIDANVSMHNVEKLSGDDPYSSEKWAQFLGQTAQRIRNVMGETKT